jgi:hypothetical protein
MADAQDLKLLKSLFLAIVPDCFSREFYPVTGNENGESKQPQNNLWLHAN